MLTELKDIITWKDLRSLKPGNCMGALFNDGMLLVAVSYDGTPNVMVCEERSYDMNNFYYLLNWFLKQVYFPHMCFDIEFWVDFVPASKDTFESYLQKMHCPSPYRILEPPVGKKPLKKVL